MTEADIVGIHEVLDVQQRCIPIPLAVAVVEINHELVERTVAEVSLQGHEAEDGRAENGRYPQVAANVQMRQIDFSSEKIKRECQEL